MLTQELNEYEDEATGLRLACGSSSAINLCNGKPHEKTRHRIQFFYVFLGDSCRIPSSTEKPPYLKPFQVVSAIDLLCRQKRPLRRFRRGRELSTWRLKELPDGFSLYIYIYIYIFVRVAPQKIDFRWFRWFVVFIYSSRNCFCMFLRFFQGSLVGPSLATLWPWQSGQT